MGEKNDDMLFKKPTPLSSYVGIVIDNLSDEQKSKILIGRKTKQVHQQFSACVDQYILDHVNSIYLTNEENVSRETIQRLTVYVDNSMVAAELNAQRELIVLKYRELFSLQIDEFVIKISRGAYMENHPFKDEEKPKKKKKIRRLSSEEKEKLDAYSSFIKDEKIRESFKRAYKTNKERS